MNTVKESSTYCQRKPLPFDYQLHDHDVFCGRGNECLNHVGNIRFRQIVLANLKRYNDAHQKTEKSSILHEIVDHIRSTSPGAGFVAKDIENGRFYEVDEISARVKTSQAFRDEIQGKYKSNRLKKTQNPMLHNNICSDALLLQPQQSCSQKPVKHLVNEVNSTVLNPFQRSTIYQSHDIREVFMNKSNSFLTVSGSVDNHVKDLESYNCYTGVTSNEHLFCATTNTPPSRYTDWNGKNTSAEDLRTSSTNTKFGTRTSDGDERKSNDAVARTRLPSLDVDAKTFDLLLEFTEKEKMG